MARRKLSLEKEFTHFVKVHKLSIIQVCLILFSDKGIYDNDILKRYKGIALSKEQKAEYVVDDAYENEEYLNELYEFCWKKVNQIIPDNMVLS